MHSLVKKNQYPTGICLFIPKWKRNGPNSMQWHCMQFHTDRWNFFSVRTHIFYDFNCKFTQIRCLSRLLYKHEHLSHCMLQNCLCFSVVIYQIFFKFSKKFFQERYQSVKQFGSRSDLMLCQSWSGPKLFAFLGLYLSCDSQERATLCIDYLTSSDLAHGIKRMVLCWGNKHVAIYIYRHAPWQFHH